ncbi:MAG: hypothetical protein KZQ83_14315, partial [gamma proteobacterium symbiont of Taylorina sp.]|nr:hypothetical protein [gamma proteobacterium symbiont of Taylorina sp.]
MMLYKQAHTCFKQLLSNINLPTILFTGEDFCKTTVGKFIGRGLLSNINLPTILFTGEDFCKTTVGKFIGRGL